MEAQAAFDVVKTSSPQKTQKIAQKLAQSLKGGNVIALFGDLGAGKTTFVQGLAKGLGIKKRIISPTFIFVRSYPFVSNNEPLIFHHVDLYRVQKTVDLKTLGLDEIFSQNSIVAIEWAEKIKDQLPQKRIDVFMEPVNETTRKITITPSLLSFPPFHLSFPRKRESKNGFRNKSGMTKGKGKFSTQRLAQGSNIKKAASILKNGGVVIFPTDTVYGIGCRFDDKKTINRIYQIKGSPKNQSFPILVSSIKQIEERATINFQAKELMQKYWPGGLTIILPGLSTYSNPGLEQLYKPGLGGLKIGFRMPDSDLVRSLIKKVGPLIGTSANFHGDKTPTSYKKLNPDIIKLADYTIKGECQLGVESTVVDVTSDQSKITRQGAVLIS